MSFPHPSLMSRAVFVAGALAAALAMIPSVAGAESPGTPGLTALMQNRPASDTQPADAVIGNGLYVDEQRNVMVTWNLSDVSGDTFALQVFNDRPLRLKLPGIVDQTCGYGAVRVGRAGELHALVGSTTTADAFVECYDSAARRNGWNINYDPCINVSHLADWEFRSDACGGTLTRVVKSKTAGTARVTAPFAMSSHEG